MDNLVYKNGKVFTHKKIISDPSSRKGKRFKNLKPRLSGW